MNQYFLLYKFDKIFNDVCIYVHMVCGCWCLCVSVVLSSRGLDVVVAVAVAAVEDGAVVVNVDQSRKRYLLRGAVLYTTSLT